MREERDWRTADYFSELAAAQKAARLDPDLPNPERTCGADGDLSLTERLRDWRGDPEEVMEEAADEIERLRAAADVRVAEAATDAAELARLRSGAAAIVRCTV